MEWQKEWTAPTVTGVVSFGLGVLTGYVYTVHKYKPYMEKLEEAVGVMREELDELLNDPGPKDGQDTHLLTEEYVPQPEHSLSVEGLQENIIHDRIVDLPRHSVFPDGAFTIEDGMGWNYEEEVKSRTPNAPYVIHYDEYDVGEPGYSQSSLTYYHGDDILTDEKDVPIYDRGKVVGELKFGHGSNDPSIVYIRNERLEADYEVILDSGAYQVVILGEEIEAELSVEKEEIRKFRPVD